MKLDHRYKLGSRIWAFRKERGLTQSQLASMIGNSSKQYISALEQGDKNVTIDVLVRIAGALDVKVRDLIDF